MNLPLRGIAARRGWGAALTGATAVTGLVVGVWLATGGAPDPTSSGSATGPSPTSAAGAIELFPADSAPVDVTRSSAVDVAGNWPLADCPSAGPEVGRVDFVSGTESGPEYSRDLAMGWYADAESAASAYDSVWSRIQTCAASSEADLQSAPERLGSTGIVATVASPSTAGQVDVAIYALTRVGEVVALVADHATFYEAAGPAPADATGTVDQATRLLVELCRVEPTHC
jgi:hypothetical protein